MKPLLPSTDSNSKSKHVHINGAGRLPGILVNSQGIQSSTQHVLVLIKLAGSEAFLSLWANNNRCSMTSSMSSIRFLALIEDNDEDPILLELRRRKQWADIVSQPDIKRAQNERITAG
jgi:hypothetical protein